MAKSVCPGARRVHLSDGGEDVLAATAPAGMTTSLLCRTAEGVYWAGRYLERAEAMSRIVLVHGDSHVDLPVGQDVGWTPLLAIAGVEAAFARRLEELGTRRGKADEEPPSALERQVVEFLLCSSDNPGSVLASVRNAREAMRSARSSIPREVWERCNDLWLALKDRSNGVRSRQDRVLWLRQAIAGCERVSGALWSTMPRDTALAFTRIGQHLERAEITCRILSVRADSILANGSQDPYEQVRSMAVLRALAAYEAFRRAVPARSDGRSVLRFLLEDETFPHTVATCLGRLRDHLKELPRNEEASAACTDVVVRMAGSAVGGGSAPEVRQFVAGLQDSISGLHHLIESTYFHGEVPMTAPGSLRPSGSTAGLDRGGHGPDRLGPDRFWPGRSPGVVSASPVATYRVVHRTVYRYESPAEQSYNEAHLRPRNTELQRRIDYELVVDPSPSMWSEHVDLLGNDVVTFLVRGGFDVLSVRSTSVIALFERQDPPLGPPWESVRSVLDVDRQAPTRAARMYRAPSRLVPVLAPLAAYAAESFFPNRSVVEAVTELCSRIHSDFTYEPGFTSLTTPLLEVFEERRGVCQDFAHVAVACLRSVGLAGRYVSGYIESAPPPGTSLIGTEASHAWASTYLPGWGWLDIDPTNDQLVSDVHVTTAWGRDFLDVSPLRGSIVGGGRAHDLEVSVEMSKVDDE